MVENKVKFDDVRIGNFVEVYDNYFERIAVGVVTEKRENAVAKYITILFGFDTTEEYVLEEKKGFESDEKQRIFINSIIR